MTKILRFLPALVAIALPSTGCSAQAAVQIPGTRLLLEDLVFAPGQQVVNAGPLGKHYLCRSGKLSSEYSAASITMWTGISLLGTFQPRKQCEFAVRPASAYLWKRGDIDTGDCRIRIKKNDNTIESIESFVSHNDSRHFFQCEFRLKMAFLGFMGALQLPERKLFEESDEPQKKYGYPDPKAYSKTMPSAFILLQRACGSVTQFRYQPRLGQTRAEVNADFQRLKCKKSKG